MKDNRELNKRNFDVYFEIYGKKIKVRVIAESENEAKRIVLQKIVFHKVEKSKDSFNQAMDMMDNIVDILNIK